MKKDYFFIRGKIRFFWICLLIVLAMILYIWYGTDFPVVKEGDEPRINDILVEFHGLLFDVILFGIVLTAYEFLSERKKNRERKEFERKLKIERLKEELNDYPGWTENEAAYRIAGIIKRLDKEGVNDIDYTNLHLGKCGVELIKECITKEIEIASLQGVNFEGEDLTGLNFEGLNLMDANLKEANLTDANLQGTELDNVFFHETTLNGTDFKFASLNGCVFWETKSVRADFEGAVLNNSSFNEDDLEGAFFNPSNLENCIFTGVNLKDADLSGANVKGTDFEDSYLDGVIVKSEKWIENLIQSGGKINDDCFVSKENLKHTSIQSFVIRCSKDNASENNDNW